MTLSVKPSFRAHEVNNTGFLGKSIFPDFAVNAPLPPGTAVPPNAPPSSPLSNQAGAGVVAQPSSGERR
jgi:hypothetical protein